MAHRKCSRALQPDDLIKVGLGIVLPISIAIGGATGFMPLFDAVVTVLFVSAAIAAIAIPVWLGWKFYERQHRLSLAAANQLFAPAPKPISKHAVTSIAYEVQGLNRYQFEKINDALLQLEVDAIGRQEGAFVDNGAALIAERTSDGKLIQRNSWKTVRGKGKASPNFWGA